jgi:hypothetical protein
VNYTLAFALQLSKKHGKPSVRAAQYKNNEDKITTKNTEFYTTEKTVHYR